MKTEELTILIPPGLPKEVWDHETTVVTPMGPDLVTMFCPIAEMGGLWRTSQRRWLLIYPIGLEEFLETVNRYLHQTGLFAGAYRQAMGQKPN